MDSQTKSAIILISIVIPLAAYGVTFTGKNYNSISASSDEEEKILVLTSFYPLLEFTKEVGKEKVDVQLIVPAGIEPHDWEPTVKDLQRIHGADLVVINGLGFEDYLDDLSSVDSGINNFIDTSKNIEPIIRRGDDDNDVDSHDELQKGHYSEISTDPHIWLNPNIAKIQVNNIAQGLINFDPENEEFYKKNAESYVVKLDMLDQKFKTELDDCKKDFIVLHNAFSYFAKEYSLHPHTILDSNEPHAEPTSRKLEKIITLASELDIDTVYTETGADPKITNLVADEIGGNVMTLSPLEIVTNDETYISKMKQNLANLKEGLCN